MRVNYYRRVGLANQSFLLSLVETINGSSYCIEGFGLPNVETILKSSQKPPVPHAQVRASTVKLAFPQRSTLIPTTVGNHPVILGHLWQCKSLRIKAQPCSLGILPSLIKDRKKTIFTDFNNFVINYKLKADSYIRLRNSEEYI